MGAAAEPFFDECKLYTYDPYWQEVFANCARNKFPRGVSYHKGRHALYVRRPGGGASETVPLPADAPEAFRAMVGVFRDKLGMRSPEDRSRAARAVAQAHGPAALELDEWKAVPRYLRDDFLSQYVARLARAKGLSSKRAHALLAYLEVGLQTKTIRPADIALGEDGIAAIAALAYDSAAGTYRLPEGGDPSAPPAPPSDASPNSEAPAEDAALERDRFLRLVDEYLKTLAAKSVLPGAPPPSTRRPEG